MLRIAEAISNSKAVEMLLRAYDCAVDVQHDVWDFAINVRTLKNAGISDTDLRWLLCRGFAVSAVETTHSDSQSRSFEQTCFMHSCDETCFVLSGIGYVTLQAETQATQDQLAENSEIRPKWEPDLHKLSFAGKVVKHYRSPSPNQEAVLAAFHEEHWTQRIDDPLPPSPDISAKRRLHDTIRNLNRNQRHPLIHFSGDGTGEGILWELAARPQ